MSIQVYFFQNFEKKKNSTKQPVLSTGTEFLCLLKEDTGVIEPEIEISLASNNPISYTYAYIPSWNRYYFVNNWEFAVGMRWRAYLEEDVMASFKTQIGALTPYVLRSSTEYDPLLSDSFYPATNSWVSTETAVPNPFDYSTGEYVIGIISAPETNTTADNSLGAVRYWHCGATKMREFISYIMSSVFMQRYYSNVLEGVTDSMVKNFVDPLQYIESIKWYPFPTRTIEYPIFKKPNIGWFDTTDDNDMPTLGVLSTKYKTFNGDSYKITLPKNPNATVGKEFLKYAPYTQYELNFQPFGVLPLNAEYLGNRTELYLDITVDYTSGMGRLSLGTSNQRADVGIYNAQIGVPVSLAQITEDILGASTSMASGILSAVGSVAGATTSMLRYSAQTGNLFAKTTHAVGNMLEGASAFLQATNDAIDRMSPQCERVGSNGTILSYIGDNHGATLIMKYCDVCGVDNDHFGRPLYKKPSHNIAGFNNAYIMCGEGENHINCYGIEKDIISSYLIGGFFYE